MESGTTQHHTLHNLFPIINHYLWSLACSATFTHPLKKLSLGKPSSPNSSLSLRSTKDLSALGSKGKALLKVFPWKKGTSERRGSFQQELQLPFSKSHIVLPQLQSPVTAHGSLTACLWLNISYPVLMLLPCLQRQSTVIVGRKIASPC